MTDKELKKALASVYAIEPQKNKNVFVRKYKRRELQLTQLLWMQAKYLLLPNIIGGVFLLLGIFACIWNQNKDTVWIVSAVVPFVVLFTMISLGKSEKYGMGELEMVSRFSLRLLKMIRVFWAGVFSFGILLIGSIIVWKYRGTTILHILPQLGIPYLLTVWGCLIVLRKWHSQENIYGCIGVSVTIFFFPFVVDTLEANLGEIPVYVIGVSLLVLFILTVNEVKKYITESGEALWNL